jgi:hypothetical protein
LRDPKCVRTTVQRQQLWPELLVNGLSEPDLVRQDDAAREWIAAGEECRLDLMGVEVDL